MCVCPLNATVHAIIWNLAAARVLMMHYLKLDLAWYGAALAELLQSTLFWRIFAVISVERDLAVIGRSVSVTRK